MIRASIRRPLPFARLAILLARVVLIVALLGELYVTATIQVPGFLHPTDIGTDTSTYFAAGQRLNAGHNLYGPLLPGDRPIPRYPSVYRAPLLSPPLIAVIWRPLALIGDPAMGIWWALDLLLVVGLAIGFAAAGGRWTLTALLVLLTLAWPFSFALSMPYTLQSLQFSISLAALSGNLNGYLVGLCVLVWWATSRGRPWIAGIAAGLAAVLKLGPFALGWWLVVRRDWSAVKAFVVTVGVLGIVGLVGAGVHANVAYLRLILGGQVGTSTTSIPGMLETWFHVSPHVANLATIVTVIGGLALIYATRRNARISFLVVMLVIVYGSPVVLIANLVLLLAASAPWEMPSGAGLRRTGSGASGPTIVS